MTTIVNCERDGVETNTCTGETRIFPQLKWSVWTPKTPATCESEGEETRTCLADLSLPQMQAIPKLVWGEWKTTAAATCEGKGVETRTCPDNASPAQTREIELKWEDWKITTPATCEKEGVYTRTCPGNASPAQTQAISQLVWGKWLIDIQATQNTHAKGHRLCPNGDRDDKSDLTLCGTSQDNVLYTPEKEFCQDGTTVKEFCGNKTTYTSTQFCQNGTTVKDLCGNKTYTSTEFCQNGTVKELCGNKTYASDEFCQEGTVKELCGDKTYSSNQFCQNGTVKDLCGNKIYTSTEFCQDGTVKELCGDKTYLSNQFCDFRDNKLYKFVTINGKVWMAENLNHRTSNGASRCHQGNSAATGTYGTSDADNANCATYGRLYNWATAMNNAASSNANPSGRQGVCPTGWHLPSDAEWTALSLASGGSGANGNQGTAGQALKAKSTLWYTNTGTDLHGFSALPSGSYSCDDCPFNQAYYNDLNYGAAWWTSTQQNGNEAWLRNVYGASNILNRTYYLKTYLYSVRCVRDN